MGSNELPSEIAEPPSSLLVATQESKFSNIETNKTSSLNVTNSVVQNKWSDQSIAQTKKSFNSRVFNFLTKCYPQATESDWNDWKWQIKNRITSFEHLQRIFELTQKEKQAFGSQKGLPLAITPYYASIIHEHKGNTPLRKTVIPWIDESLPAVGESADPLAENEQSPVPGLVHRYPDRVLFLTTNVCASYCRYCTRSRLVGQNLNTAEFSRTAWEKCISYIEVHKEIRDVLLSGGDPLMLPNNSLRWLLERLRKIKHVEILRIGTKVPVVLPQRITPALSSMLKRFHPLFISIHCTHPHELTSEMENACNMLADAGIPLGSQTVLLAGINDNVEVMRKLMHGLLRFRVRPYYLYQCDPIIGSAHFRTPVKKGLEIIEKLRGFTSGYAVPTFVVDAPAGGGKIPLNPQYVVAHENETLLMKNYRGIVYKYPDNI